MARQLFNVPVNKTDQKSSNYTTKINIPQYLPTGKKPEVYELCDKTKYLQLVQDIVKSNVPQDVKDFLLLAATRHIVFNYSKIADFYAESDADVQKLMEKSALVIIDFDDAIANGYVRFSKRIENIMKESGESPYEK